jgi:hopanoid biosynthesis associated RND transporter like protein HpnN
MRGLNTHPVEQVLRRLAECVCRRPAWFIYPQLLLFVLSLAYAGFTLKLKTDANDLVSPNVGYQRQWQEVREEFHMQDDFVTLVESEDPAKNRQFVERLAARVELEPELFTAVYYKGDVRNLGPKALLMLPEEKLEALLRGLREGRIYVGKMGSVTNLDSLFREIQAQWLEVLADESKVGSFADALPALRQVVQQGAESLQRKGAPPSPGLTTLFAAREDPSQGGYLQIAGGRIYLFTCSAHRDADNPRAVRRLRELVEQTRSEVPGVNVGVTGLPVLNLDEMTQAEEDTTRASIVSLIIVALTFIFCYQQVARPLKATACLVVGLGYTLGFTALTVGHLNILTITFVPILIGMAIDFGVHLIARYEEELRFGCDEKTAMTQAMIAGGTGIITSGFTTAAAFLAMLLTSFKGIREMGIIAGGGLLICLVPMMTLLPALLLQTGRRRWHITIPPKLRMLIFPPRPRAWHKRREQMEQLWLHRPRAVMWVGGVITVAALALAGRVTFDYNPLHLQSQNLPAVQYEHRIIESASRSILSSSVAADSVEDALRLEREFRALPSVADVDSVAPFLAGDQQTKRDLVRRIVRSANAIRLPPMDEQPVDLTQLDESLHALGRMTVGALQFGGASLDEFTRSELTRLREAAGQWRDALAHSDTNRTVSQLTQYQQALFRDVSTSLAALRAQQYDKPLRAEDLPPGLRSRFVGRTGKLLLQVYPRENIWEHEACKRFVNELRSVAPDATNTPVLLYENTRRLKTNFQMAAVYACMVIALMLLVHFRNVTCLLLAMLPVVIGIIWTFGLMGALGIAFNPVNIIAPTLLIGIGVTNGIQILNRFTEEQHPSILGKSTGKAVLVSALTTCTGFGSLIPAEHEGIGSLGVVMAAGSAFCMIASLTILPALLILLIRAGFKLSHGWLGVSSSSKTAQK